MEDIIMEGEQQPKKWEFRRLKGKDIFLMLPVLKKIGINNVKKCFSGDIVKGIVATNKGKDYDKQVEAATLGAMLEFGQVLIEGLDNCENEIFNDVNLLRLRSLSLSYNFPKALMKKTGFLKGANVSVAANNLLLFTNYNGDPEAAAAGAGVGGSSSVGFDYCGIPSTSGMTFGINLTF